MVVLSSIIDELTALADDLGALGEAYTRDVAVTHTPATADRVTVAVPATVDAAFAIETRLGSTSVEGLSMLVDEETRNSIRGELGAGGPRLDVRTKLGAVTLTSH